MPKGKKAAEGCRAMEAAESVVSAGECTGMMPAMTEDGEETVCRMLRVHEQPERGKKEGKA